MGGSYNSAPSSRKWSEPSKKPDTSGGAENTELPCIAKGSTAAAAASTKPKWKKILNSIWYGWIPSSSRRGSSSSKLAELPPPQQGRGIQGGECGGGGYVEGHERMSEFGWNNDVGTQYCRRFGSLQWDFRRRRKPPPGL